MYRGVDHFGNLNSKRRGYEAARQDEPVEGSSEEEECQKKPEKIKWGKEDGIVVALLWAEIWISSPMSCRMAMIVDPVSPHRHVGAARTSSLVTPCETIWS
jgi:hypothetical protein